MPPVWIQTMHKATHQQRVPLISQADATPFVTEPQVLISEKTNWRERLNILLLCWTVSKGTQKQTIGDKKDSKKHPAELLFIESHCVFLLSRVMSVSVHVLGNARVWPEEEDFILTKKQDDFAVGEGKEAWDSILFLTQGSIWKRYRFGEKKKSCIQIMFHFLIKTSQKIIQSHCWIFLHQVLHWKSLLFYFGSLFRIFECVSR